MTTYDVIFRNFRNTNFSNHLHGEVLLLITRNQNLHWKHIHKIWRGNNQNQSPDVFCTEFEQISQKTRGNTRVSFKNRLLSKCFPLNFVKLFTTPFFANLGKNASELFNVLFNPFHATGLFQYPPENMRKPEVFSCFQGYWKRTVALTKIKRLNPIIFKESTKLKKIADIQMKMSL